MLWKNRNNPYYIRCIYVKEKPSFMRLYRHFALLTERKICCKIATQRDTLNILWQTVGTLISVIPLAIVTELASCCTYITIEKHQPCADIFRVVIPSCCYACVTAFCYACIISLPCPVEFVRYRWALGCNDEIRPESVHKNESRKESFNANLSKWEN